jgi:hypothetical protein
VVTTTPVSGPTNGTIVINPDGTYVYTPNPNFNGTDVITIQVCDSGPGVAYQSNTDNYSDPKMTNVDDDTAAWP